MKTKKLFFLATSAICFFVLGFSSCGGSSGGGDDADTTKPVVKIITPASGAVVKVGGYMDFSAQITDNESLASYTVKIEHDFNASSTLSTQPRSVVPAPEDSVGFEVQKTWPLDGKASYTIEHAEIDIKSTQGGEPVRSGKYRIVVTAKDKAGNEGSASHDITLSYK